MRNDHPISKWVRPGILIWLTAILSVLMIIDGNFFGVVVKSAWISLLESITMVAFSAYFLGRSYEKGKSILKKKDEE